MKIVFFVTLFCSLVATAKLPGGAWNLDQAETWLRQPYRTQQERAQGARELADHYRQLDRWQEAIWTLRFGNFNTEAAALEQRLEKRMMTEAITEITELADYYHDGPKKVRLGTGRLWAIVKSKFVGSGPFNGEEFVAYREVAAFLLDRLLGLDLVPTTILREFDGRLYAFQYFVRNTHTPSWLTAWGSDYRNKRYPTQLKNMWLLDYLLNNQDRHAANWLRRFGNVPVAIDHGYSLGRTSTGQAQLQLELLPDGEILERLKNLKPEDFRGLRVNTTELFLRRDHLISLAENKTILQQPLPFTECLRLLQNSF